MPLEQTGIRFHRVREFAISIRDVGAEADRCCLLLGCFAPCLQNPEAQEQHTFLSANGERKRVRRGQYRIPAGQLALQRRKDGSPAVDMLANASGLVHEIRKWLSNTRKLQRSDSGKIR